MTAQEYVLAPTPAPPAPPPVEEQKANPFPKKILIAFGVVGVLLVFFSGFFIRGAVQQPAQVAVIPTPTPTLVPPSITVTPTPFSEVPIETIQFLPRKQYFEDTYVAVTKSAPYQTVILSVSRIEQQRDYVQFMKINYYNGKEWIRRTITNTNRLPNATVSMNLILKKWKDATTLGLQSKEDIVQLLIDDQTLLINSQTLRNEISVQSVPGATKFIYQGTGTLQIDDDPLEAYVFYARSYSFNASDLAFLTDPASLTSQWAVFWDTEGAFYHLDRVNAPNPSSEIQNRTIGIRETIPQTVTKTENVSAQKEMVKDVQIYKIDFQQPIREKLQMSFANAVNKSDKRSYEWFLGSGNGVSVKSAGRSVNGVGVFEFIQAVR